MLIPIKSICIILKRKAKEILRESLQTSGMLFKIMVPLIVITKILRELGAIEIISHWLEPCMHLVGLPGSMGLVWATGIVTNLYGALLVFVSLGSTPVLTIAQVTVLATLLLLAHALPIELKIAQKTGIRIHWMFLIRIGGALCLGMILNGVFSLGHLLQAPSHLLWSPAPEPEGWGWIWREIKNLFTIYCVIMLLLILLDFLKWTGLIKGLNRLLTPVLNFLGIGYEATHLILIGMTLGLGYGGGLLIREVHQGHVPSKDVFVVMVFMGLCHSLIEDTLLMTALGAHFSGILLGRVLFAFIITLAFSQSIRKLHLDTFYRYWYHRQLTPKLEDVL